MGQNLLVPDLAGLQSIQLFWGTISGYQGFDRFDP
jgi:hypothetical protein